MPLVNKPKTHATASATSADQVVLHPIAKADAAAGRYASRATVEFVLRSMQLISSLSGGDPILALVLRTIISANVSHVDRDPKLRGRFASIDDTPPDELRRPISVLAVAQSLSLPYETTRRYANKLVKSGQCVRVKGGLIAPAARHQEPEDHQAIMANMANLRRLYEALKTGGIVFD